MDSLTDALTIEDVRAAQRGDDRAVESCLTAMRSRVEPVARHAARNMFKGDAEHWLDEFMQVANVAMWGALSTFDSSDVGTFYGYMYSTAQRAITGAASEARYAGVDRDAHRTFAYWVAQCDGDLDLAEQMAQRFPDPAGRKLGRDRAHAARLAWVNPNSIEGFSASVLGDPYEGRDGDNGAVRYADLLVSALGIPDELFTSDDMTSLESRARHEMTHAVLGAMGPGAADVLRYTYGIGGYSAFGVDANAEIGACVGKTARQVIDARTKGYKAFAQRFIRLLVAQEPDSEAAVTVSDDWWHAFHAERARSNARGNNL